MRETLPDAEPAVRWLPFQLNPGIPESGMPRKEYVERKFGPGGHGRYARVAAVGKSVGIDFAFDRIEVQPNTVAAHRLMYRAEAEGRQDEVAEALFRAYFIEGANLSDTGVLADAAVAAGFEHDAIMRYLESTDDRDTVERTDAELRAGGVEGVPFFIFNREVAVSGAQDADVLLDAMRKALAAA